MPTQRVCDNTWQNECASAAVRLRLEQGELATHPGERVTDPELPTIKVDVPPAQTEQFALAEARPERSDPKRPVAVVLRGIDELPRLLRGER